LNESRHHFEGIRGESHRINVSYLFENITISLILVRGTAKVASFSGPEEGRRILGGIAGAALSVRRKKISEYKR
jgi:hypothetical protein